MYIIPLRTSQALPKVHLQRNTRLPTLHTLHLPPRTLPTLQHPLHERPLPSLQPRNNAPERSLIRLRDFEQPSRRLSASAGLAAHARQQGRNHDLGGDEALLGVRQGRDERDEGEGERGARFVEAFEVERRVGEEGEDLREELRRERGFEGALLGEQEEAAAAARGDFAGESVVEAVEELLDEARYEGVVGGEGRGGGAEEDCGCEDRVLLACYRGIELALLRLLEDL